MEKEQSDTTKNPVAEPEADIEVDEEHKVGAADIRVDEDGGIGAPDIKP